MSFAGTVKNTELRARLQSELENSGAQSLHDRLCELDPETADRLHVNDVKRVIRALEIILTTGKTLKENSDRQADAPDVIMVAFDTDRGKLYDHINARVDEMFSEGLTNEVLGIGRFDCQSMQAIGYKEFADCKFTKTANGFILADEEETRVKELIKQHTRNYAKRQLTWFRRYKFIKWFECGDYAGTIDYVKSQIEQRISPASNA